MRFPLHRPVVGAAEREAVAEVLASGWLAQGPKVAAFEQCIVERLAMPYAVAVTSCTAALHLSVIVQDIAPGDEVIVPAFGFPATANAVELAGGCAVPADVDWETFALTPETIAAKATDRTVGVIVVHPFGIPAQMSDISAQAKERGWWVVEDAACALGTAREGRWARGEHLVCLSFHPRKVLTTGEGGIIACSDQAVASRLRRLRSHGIAPDRGWESFVDCGFNYRMSDLNAAVGVVQMDKLDAVVEQRRQIVGDYRERLKGLAGVSWHGGYDLSRLSCQSMVVTLDAGIERDQVISKLAASGVQTTIGGYSVTLQPYYQQRYDLREGDCPNAEAVFRQSLTLPVNEAMNSEDVGVVCGILGEVIDGD